jgi:hypothetical protein
MLSENARGVWIPASAGMTVFLLMWCLASCRLFD